MSDRLLTLDSLENERNSVIRKNMREIRKQSGKTQQKVAQGLLVDRTVYCKYETGRLTPSMEFLQRFAAYFNIPPDSLEKSVSAVIPDTSALLKNRRLLSLLLHDFDTVIIPDVVLNELDRQKNRGRNQKAAWQVMMTIADYRSRYSSRLLIAGCGNRRAGKSDTVAGIASAMNKKLNKTVYLIHDDVGMTLKYKHSILLRDYIAKRTKHTDYEALLSLDEAYDRLDRYRSLAGTLDLNAYLPDGMTLLISCIRCNDRDKVDARGGRRISGSKRRGKLEFLLSSGADPDKTDSSRYCLTPLAHCVQTGDFQAFCILLAHGADYNKGSVDEITPSCLKMHNANEGNTPLMIACWHCGPRFVQKLCRLPDISLNQQDSNGYTALHKCAVQRYNLLKRGSQPAAARLEPVYRSLLALPRIDPLIRDRNNKTAADWWREGDKLRNGGTADD